MYRICTPYYRKWKLYRNLFLSFSLSESPFVDFHYRNFHQFRVNHSIAAVRFFSPAFFLEIVWFCVCVFHFMFTFARTRFLSRSLFSGGGDILYLVTSLALTLLFFLLVIRTDEFHAIRTL